jgi:capsular polysaccharide transport system permease protein
VAESVLRPIHIWLNVINALLLRDIRVRAGKFYTGYLVIFLMPFAHLGIVLVAFVFVMRRAPPFGTDSIIFYGLSTLPFVIFVYPARQIVVGLAQNRPLLYFPRVKIIDVIVARGLLESANGMAVSGVVLLVLFLASGEFEPRDPAGIMYSLLLTLYIGVAWGAYHSLFAHLFPFWALCFNLFFPLLWIASGILINVHGLPTQFQHYFAFNPLLQCIEYIRYSYYQGYPADILDVAYVFWFATCLLALTLVLERLLRRQLLSA